MKNLITPHYFSQVTHQIHFGFIEVVSEDITMFSSASSFLYKYNKKTYLITNWHNITGRNPIKKEPLSKTHLGIPNFFYIYFREKDGGGAAKRQNILLYEDVELTKPKWLVHPELQEQVDVVAIELKKDENFVYHSINEFSFDNDILPEVSDDCFIIGYPFKEHRYLGLPIWKRGSIASEPTVNEDQLPKLLVDSATRSGLSGSPVIYERTGIHKVGIDGNLKNDAIIGKISGFLGVYSGRIGEGELKAQLGIVWKKKVIEEIITGEKLGNIDFQSY
jgi:hypothetical protein